MPKRTLKDMTNNILSAMDSDEVNAIYDTIESEQVAEIIKETYFAMLDELNLPNTEELFHLDSAVAATPYKMKMPDDIHNIYWIKYNVDTTGSEATYRDIKYLSPKDFVDQVLRRNETASNITKITDNVDLLILTDAMPSYWTSFDDENIIFDSYDSSVESNLQSQKTTCHGIKEPTWTTSDTFIPDLPTNLFSLLLTESKSTAFFNIKQVANSKEEQKARRQRIALRKNKWRQNGSISVIDYGRRK